VILQGKPLWTKPTAHTYLPLYQATTRQPDTLLATGHFAKRDASGALLPLRRESRPAPEALKPNPAYAVNQSLLDVPAISSGHAKGSRLLKGQHYIEMDGLTFRVQYDARMGYWQIINPDNPFAFFGNQPVRLDDQGQWQLIDNLNLRGGVGGHPRFRALDEEAAGPSTAVGDISDYELPDHMQPYLQGIVKPLELDELVFSGLGIDTLMDEFYAGMRSNFTTLRQNLYRDASAFFDQVALPARPTLPVLAEAATAEELIKGVYANAQGLVIREAPTSIFSKRLLIENMPLLAEQQVEVLYIEHLFTDLHRRKLDKYRTLGSKTKAGSKQLKHHFKELEDGALNTLSDHYTYYRLVKTAHQHGIEVRPLSSSISYPFKDHPVPTAVGDETSAQKMSLFFGHKVLAADIATKPERRWVALLSPDIAHAHRQLPGIRELHGAISVRVEDVRSGPVLRVSRDPDGDFTVAMTEPQNTATAATETTGLDNRLYGYLTGEPFIKVRLDPRTLETIVTPRDIPNPYAGEHGFLLNEQGRWQRINPALWEADLPPTPIQNSLMDSTYEMPVESRATLHELINFVPKGMRSGYLSGIQLHNQVFVAFDRLRSKLQRDARNIIAADLPPRPVFPSMPADLAHPRILDRLYENTSGVVVGESHASVASKKFILDNLQHLSDRQVKTLYMEHLLTDLHQADLDRFAETGQMSKRLLHDLKSLDHGHRTDRNGVYTFENLVIQARHHGLEVRAIDTSTSYHLKDIASEAPTTRQQMMNFFASRTIRRHQEVMGAHKWIALMGNTHANTFHNLVPGIAELEQGIGIRVIDVGPGQSRGVMLDPGESLADSLGQNRTFVQSDYRLEIETR
jgi:hypothetical protein